MMVAYDLANLKCLFSGQIDASEQLPHHRWTVFLLGLPVVVSQDFFGGLDAYVVEESGGDEDLVIPSFRILSDLFGIPQDFQIVAYSSDLTDAQWKFLEPLLLVPSKRGPKHGNDLRKVVEGMLYISHTGCQWRYLPDEFGPWTRVWSQFRRWSRNGTWTQVLAALHASSRTALGLEGDLRPSMVVIERTGGARQRGGAR